MKKMKRILAAGLMLLALAGCGTSDNQAAEYPGNGATGYQQDGAGDSGKRHGKISV